MRITFHFLFLPILFATMGCTDAAHERAAERSQPPAMRSPTRQEAEPIGPTPQPAETRAGGPDTRVGPPNGHVGEPTTRPSVEQARETSKDNTPTLEARVEKRLKNYERMLAEEGIELTDKERAMHREQITESEVDFEAAKGIDIPMGKELDRQLNEAVGNQGPDAPQMGVRARQD